MSAFAAPAANLSRLVAVHELARRDYRTPLDSTEPLCAHLPYSTPNAPNSRASCANTATNNFRVRSHPRLAATSKDASSYAIFSLQLTRRLKDVQDGANNLRLDLATAEDLLLAANAHRQELLGQVASAEEAHEEENTRHLRSAAPAAPAQSSSNSVGAPVPCPVGPSASPFTAPTLTPSPLRPAKLMSAGQRTARSTPYPSDRKLAPNAKGKHAKENGGKVNLAAAALKRKRDHGGDGEGREGGPRDGTMP
ncbi:hypothetical protein B0H13DRAFT_1902034 [Mycena leptocephala]|nr:hypothetical protein B0H13DRAFT_1902034 [Mycena leptocephala]